MNSDPPKDSWTPTNPAFDPSQPMQVGGQAVIEGVMMRAPGSVATAVRRADGSIVVQKFAHRTVTEKYRWLNKPVLRGAIGLIDMMAVGIRTLNYSAEVAVADAEVEERKKKGTGQVAEPQKGKERSQWALVGSLILAIGLGVLIFFVTPLAVTTFFFDLGQNALAFNLVTGLVRITLFLLYLTGISFLKDIRILFQYHGAEHKAVFAFELNTELIPSQVALQSRFHPRCGTSFLLIVMFVAILSFAMLDWLLLQALGNLTLAVRLLTHIPFIPVVGGLSYEIIKFSARNASTWWGRLLVTPGLWLQGITTKEPDERQIEVALVALRCALGLVDASHYAHPDEAAREAA